MSSSANSNTTFVGHLLSLVQATGGIVVVLLVGQFISGGLLTFFYVPSVDHAYTTVSFIEKVLSSGSWIRSVHHYGSQWLPFFLFLHIAALFLQRKYEFNRIHWISAVVLLGLVMAAAATGYSLPWDARAFFSTRIAEGLISGLPLVGRGLRLWLLGSDQISTLTLSRFFALHVLVTPFLIIAVAVWRCWSSLQVCRESLVRHVVAAALVFVALTIWALKNPAPLGPSAAGVTTDYLPRPGAQFLWLYQMLKYLPGRFGSLIGVVVPGLALLTLAVLPWLDKPSLRRFNAQPQKLIGGVILVGSSLLIVLMTSLSYISDRKDPRTREQLARQAAAEEVFRRAPFVTAPISVNDLASSNNFSSSQPPEAYKKFCANCHGIHGEGGRQGTLRFPSLLGVSAKPRRTVDDIIGLLNDPQAYGLEPPMRSFATKLTDQEKREVAQWVANLK